MNKYQSIMRIMLAIAIMFGVQTTANAQLGKLKGLAKKAKESVKISVSEGYATTTDVDNPKTSSHPKTLQKLDPKLFIYQPVESNSDFYDVNSPKVQEVYNKVLMCRRRARGNDADMYRAWLTEFADYNAANGVRQIPVMEYPTSAFYAYFMMNPDTPEGYMYLYRAKSIASLDLHAHDYCRVYPRILTNRGWDDKYKRAEEMRKIDIEEYGGTVQLLETDDARRERWTEVEQECEAIYNGCTSYNTVKKVIQDIIAEIHELEKQGNLAECHDRLDLLQPMMANYLNSKFSREREADADAAQDINDDYQPIIQKWKTYQDAAVASCSATVEMPKAASVSAEIQNQATAKAKEKFGAKFVKAIVTESDWHVYTDPNNFNRTSHRSINVAVITKDGDQYFVRNQDLRQYFNAGSWGNYDMRNSMKGATPLKVNYK